MKVFVLSLLFTVIIQFSVPSYADNYLCFTLLYDDHMHVAELPGPGSHSGLNITGGIELPSEVSSLTYDGNHWWIDTDNQIYCFDINGYYVSSFYYGPYTAGLGWDGEYLWIGGEFFLCQRDTAGNPGPYGDWTFYHYVNGLAIDPVDDIVFVAYTDSFNEFYLDAYTFNGDFICRGVEYHAVPPDWRGISGVAYDGNIIWVAYSWGNSHVCFSYVQGYIYDPDGDWELYSNTYYSDSRQINNLTICDREVIGNAIESSSLGKIKAYFNGQ